MGRFNLILLLLLMWLGHFCVDVMLGIWPVYKTLAEFNLATAGLMVALGAFIGEGSQLLFGVLGDRGYRRLLLAGGVLISGAAAFLAYTSGFLAMFSLFLLTCIGSGAFHPSAAAVMNSLIPSKRGLFMTIFASGGNLGMGLSQIIFTHQYYKETAYFIAIPAVLLCVFILLKKIPETVPQPKKEGLNLSEFIGFFKRKELRALYFAQVANQALLWGMIFILPDTLKCLGFESWICFGGGHLIFILGGVAMLVPAGYLADKYCARNVMLVASIISAVLFYMTLYFTNVSPYFTLLLLFVLGGGISVVNPIAVSLGNKFVPDKPGTISAFLMGLVWCASETIGPGGVGLVSTFFGEHAPVKALAVLGVLFVVCIYATLQLPKRSADVLINVSVP